jgi:hypothetical protein
MAEVNKLYETEDFSPRGIRWFVVVLTILALTVFVLMAWLLWVLSDGRPPGQGLVTPTTPAPNLSAAPDLQVASSRDYEEMRALEESQLRSYGWVDREAGIAAIPIERAMELLAQRGLPVQTSPGTTTQSRKEQP